MSDLQSDHLKDLLTYHTALKQFLSVSNAPAKSNPKRAAKAREKLLKLSATQFYELSTDVYDELERRIDESREEPDFLLPKSSFHPKRNEAREKLGSLQQGRFRDLVSDIFYEIERREYHKPQPQLQQQQQHGKNSSVPSVAVKGSRTGIQQDTHSSPRSNRYSKQSLDQRNSPGSNRGSDNSSKNGVVGLQSTTVIPTKAELAWSSDSEDEESLNQNQGERKQQQHQQQQQSRGSINGKRISKSSMHSSHSNTESPNKYHQQKRYSDQSSINRQSYGSEKDLVGEMHDSSQHGKRSSHQLNRGLSVLKNDKQRDIQLLMDEATKMDNVITQLEQKNAILQSKSDKFQHETKNLEIHIQTLRSKISALEDEIAVKDKKLKVSDDTTSNSNGNRDIKTINATRDLEINNSPNNIDQGALDDMRREVLDWRSKFEDLKLKKIEDLLSLDSISENSVSSLLTISGLIPIGIVRLLRDSIQSFLIFLNKSSNVSRVENNEKIDVNILFDHISKISNISGKIASFAPDSEKSDLIRASISHSITSARYYALYSEFLPKLIVESAVSEVAFSICDLISDVKLNKDKTKYDSSEFSMPDTISKDDEDESHKISPVRPLRMTKKIGETPTSQSSKTIEAPSSSSTANTPRPLNLTINTQGANSLDKSFTSGTSAKKPIQGLNGLTSPISKATKRSSGIVDNEGSPSSLNNTRDLNNNKSLSNVSTNVSTNISNNSTTTPTSSTTPLKKNGFPSIISRYSPESERKSSESTPVQGLRKSSSSNILSKVRQFEQRESDSSSISSPQRSVVSPFSESKFGKNAPNRSSLESQTDSSSTESPGNLKPIGKLQTNDDKKSKEIVSETKPSSDQLESDFDKEVEPLRNREKSSSTTAALSTAKGEFGAATSPSSIASKPKSQINDNVTSNEFKPLAKSIEAPKEVKGINYDDSSEEEEKEEQEQEKEEKEEDFTSLDQLKGEIKKNAGLKPKSQDTNEFQKDRQLQHQNQHQLQQSLGEDFTKPIVVEDDEDEDDLNEPVADGDIEGIKESRDLEPYKVNGYTASKNAGSANDKMKDEIKIERKQLNEAFVEPPSNLSKDTSSSTVSQSNMDPDSNVGVAKTKEINGFNDNVVKPLNLGSKGTSSKSDFIDAPSGNGLESSSKYGGDNYATAQEQSEDEKYDDAKEAKEETIDKDVDSTRRNRNDIEEDFDVRQFDIEDPDNTLSELLLYLEHQTVKVISTIQTLLTSIKAADSTKGELRSGSRAINGVVSQMVEATSNSMDQSRNAQLREHGIWVVQSLEDSGRRMDMLCNSSSKDGEEHEDDNEDYADKHFKQRLAGIAFDVAKCTKELVKTVEEANLKEEIAHLDARLGQ